MKNSPIKLFAALVFLTSLSSAQTFRYQVEVQTPCSPGLYRLALKPDWISKMNPERTDVRLKDKNGRELAFDFRETEQFSDSLIFKPFKIHAKRHQDTFTELVVENSGRLLLSTLLFQMGNSDAVKYCSVDGSEDLKQWYSISARQEIRLMNSANSSVTFKQVDFPSTEHRYLKLLIADLNSRPFEIKSVGYYDKKQIQHPLVAIPLHFKSTDNAKNKTTEVLIEGNRHLIHALDFSVSSPRLYRRQAELYAQSGSRRDLIANLTITQLESPFRINLSGIQEERLVLVIHNEDNLPLQISSVMGFQKEQWLISDRDSLGAQLFFGGAEDKKVNYDIASFIRADFMSLPVLTTGSLKVIPAEPMAAIDKPKAPFYEQTYFLWLCLLAGASVAVYFSFHLLKDMKDKA